MTNLRLIAAAALLTLAATPAMAQNWTSNRMGPFTFHNGTDSDGNQWSGTSQQLGQFRYDSFTGPNGRTQNCQTSQLGEMAFTNCD